VDERLRPGDAGVRDAADGVVGSRLFTDGVTRPVHRGPDGHEYVSGYDGGRVYRTWLVPPADPEPDTAIIVVDTDRRG
jgi:hypothetical protein